MKLFPFNFYLVGMSRPQSVVAQMLIPKNLYEFSLNVRDIRLIWATNCGSISFIDSIPIYRGETFGAQLSDNLRFSTYFFFCFIFL